MTVPNNPSPSQQPKSPHLTSSPLLLPFLNPTFSPSTYLNAHLPPPPPPQQSTTTTTTTPKTETLTTLASSTRAHISTLSALLTTLSATLTSLTDAIQRAAPRLGYAIEVLASDAESLAAAVPRHVPGGITTFNDENDNDEKEKKKKKKNYDDDDDDNDTNEDPKIAHSGEEEEETKGGGRGKEKKTAPPPLLDPELDLNRLRTLQRVRKHSDSVQRIFALALDFSPFPPSLLLSSSSLSSSSLIGMGSVITSPSTNPSSSLQHQQQQVETTGQAALGKLKAEVLGSVVQEGEDMGMGDGGEVGKEKAREKVRMLRDVVRVWRGTGEEGPREKWVLGLEGEVEEALLVEGRGGRRRRGRG